VRATTRSIVVSAVSIVMVVSGGISMALSQSAASFTPVCQAAAPGALYATSTGFPEPPAPTEFPLPSLTPPSAPTCPPSAWPTFEPSGSPSAVPSGTPTATPTNTPSEPAPPEVKPPDCSEPPTDAEIKKVFEGWNAAIQNDADKVADRYHTEAILLSTLKDKPYEGKANIRTYFVDFVKRKPKAEITDRQIEILGDKAAVDTGLYTFTFGDGKEPASIKARFTYVYKVVDGKCLIVSHHSSPLPEK
jgi:uncharacterized protein (TIGR02246 family)